VKDIKSRWASEWTATNPILRNGELGHEKNSGRIKIGNGRSRWSELSFMIGDLPNRLSEEELKTTFITPIGSAANPITDPNHSRPDDVGVGYWMMASGVTPVNAVDGDLIWNADE
jgi:hypothetical protein